MPKHNYDTYDVFTPSQPAELTFVDRENLNKQLVEAIRTPGRQIVVYGYSGSGKTTLINNKLHQLYEHVIESQCTKGTTIDQLILSAFDSLDKYYISEKPKSKSNEISAGLKNLYTEIKLSSTVQTTEKWSRIVPVQLTDQRLAEFIGEARACWKIEDFHKVEKVHKQRLSQIMKVFVDASRKYKSTKIIAIGAVGTGKEVVEYDNEMKGRISEIFVPLMNNEELEDIIKKGEKLLNISFSPSIKEKIIAYSNGLGAVCHQLCLSMCTNRNIFEKSRKKQLLDVTDLELAVNDYLSQNSATLKLSFDKAIKSTKRSVYGTKEILRAILRIKREEVNRQEIYIEVQKEIPNYPRNTFSKYLNQLVSGKRDEVLRLNKDANTYYFSNPFQKAYMELFFSKEQITIKNKTSSISTDEILKKLKDSN